MLQSAPFDKREEADKKRQEMAVGNSDHLTLLRSYKVPLPSPEAKKYQLSPTTVIFLTVPKLTNFPQLQTG